MPLLSHLVELRDRLLKSVLTILVIFLALFYFANDIYTFVAAPLVSHLPGDATMIAIDVASPFIAPLKLTLILSIYIAIPVLFYHLWGFVAPALYAHEKQLIVPLLVSSSLLFYLGMLFAYFVVFPLVFGFFVSVLPDDVQMSTDISSYLNFVLKMFFAFGLAFEVPVITILLVWTGMASVESLASKRPYIIVGAFVLGMILTPPDMFSQVLLAIPMWLLFELGLWMSQFLLRKRLAMQAAREKQEAEEAAAQAYPEDFTPMTPAEMDAELERTDEEDEAATDTKTIAPFDPDASHKNKPK
ncbi:twin-arginine translocase subunit TatC [Candidatus Venteria ishoeyi]|nr:twin-arginine translocase subunit TatC [Candidatus Venteria ishoeyi]MDM8547914.1 twin-arginine translocase subunit TatC [Candidatus Venteria ishoeyi]